MSANDAELAEWRLFFLSVYTSQNSRNESSGFWKCVNPQWMNFPDIMCVYVCPKTRFQAGDGGFHSADSAFLNGTAMVSSPAGAGHE